MPELRFPPDTITNDAEFSEQKSWRYWLSRNVPENPTGPLGLLIGLNPSDAGAAREDTDHTITKEIEFARRWGWRGFWKGNLFALVSKDSSKLIRFDYYDAIGEPTDAYLENMASRADQIVVCWGGKVPRLKRIRIGQVLRLLRRAAPAKELQCFGVGKHGQPIHPLRLSYATLLVPFGGEEAIGNV
ncbi:MAG TPA: DUF1643 domain-containing protein [Polyangiaceae bacterium]|nr:DUF1643 domain-containing protein [Polyangiaceae bacterium]